MSEPQLTREVKRRLAIIRHVEEVTGNVALTCRYFGISRRLYCVGPSCGWLRPNAASHPPRPPRDLG